MPVIGIFRPSKDGGWIGTIRTLTINAKVRFVPNDNRQNENAPAFRVFVGMSCIGDAWLCRSGEEKSRDYLRVKIDDFGIPAPVTAILFWHDESSDAKLVWDRGRGSRSKLSTHTVQGPRDD